MLPIVAAAIGLWNFDGYFAGVGKRNHAPPDAHQLRDVVESRLIAKQYRWRPGTHGAGVLGIQGMGVSTPRAAAVAAATVGFASDVHTPKGMMLTMGM